MKCRTFSITGSSKFNFQKISYFGNYVIMKSLEKKNITWFRM